MNIKDIKYTKTTNSEFVKTLNAKVKSYFDTNNKSMHANTQMVLKTIIIVTIYFVPLAVFYSTLLTNVWLMFGLWIWAGIGMAGIGMAVMHDANHGAYSSNAKVNKYMSLWLHAVGGYVITWKLQHNVLHHSFTNISGYDEDIASGKLMRLSPHEKHHFMYRFQHIYAWFLYALMTVSWTAAKDYKQLYRYHKFGLLKTQTKTFAYRLINLIFTKIGYLTYSLALPMILIPIAWYWILIGYLVMHFTAGFILGITFQCAHVMPSSQYPLPATDGTMDHDKTVHQLLTTTDFAPNSRVISWFLGGLNYQVEHHLFPNICHIHYRKLSKIVKSTIEEFSLPYNVQPSFFTALANHYRMLKTLGNPA